MAKDSSATKMCEAEALFPGRMKDPKDLKRETPMAATVTVKFFRKRETETERESSQRESQLYYTNVIWTEKRENAHPMTEYVANALAASATSAIAGLLCATAACASKHANDDAVKEPTTTAALFFSDDADAFPFPSAPTLPPLVFAATATRRPLTFNLLTFFCALALVVVVCESNKAGEDDIVVVIIILLDIREEKERKWSEKIRSFSFLILRMKIHTHKR